MATENQEQIAKELTLATINLYSGAGAGKPVEIAKIVGETYQTILRAVVDARKNRSIPE